MFFCWQKQLDHFSFDTFERNADLLIHGNVMGARLKIPFELFILWRFFFYQKKVPAKTFHLIFSLVEEKSGLNMKIHLSSICVDVLQR